MINNKRKNVLVLFASAFLFLALIDGWPYGFFTLLRFAIFTAAGYIAWMAYEQQKEKWAWTYGFLVVIFNPFIVIQFSREIWRVIDLVAGVLMIVSVFTLKLTNKPSES